MPARRRSASDLPRAPLELLHPLTAQGGDPVGAELLADGAGEPTLLLFRLHRALLAWTADPAAAAFDPDALRRIEDRLLATLDSDPLSAPLAVLVHALLDPAGANRARAAWACMAVSDWAVERGARQTALAFAQLAALSAPRNARYAWLVARLRFADGRLREAEPWYRRAHRVAVWTDDREVQVRSLNSLGLSYYELGRYPLAKHFYHQAIKAAGRHGLRELEAMATHNLFVVHTESREDAAAEHYAVRAFELYGPGHPRLPEFVADVAMHWNDQGHYRRSIPIFRALADRFTHPDARVRIAAGTARAAGSLQDRQSFTENWRAVWAYCEAASPGLVPAGTLYDAAIGAANLGDVELATLALRRSLEIATVCGAAQMVAKAENGLAKLSQGKDLDLTQRRRAETSSRGPADRFAQELVHSLDAVVTRVE